MMTPLNPEDMMLRESARHKRKTLYDSMYMRFPEEANSCRRGRGGEEKRGGIIMGKEFMSEMIKKFWGQRVVIVHSTVN